MFVLLFSINGSFIAFKVSQHSVKNEVKRKIRSRIPETDLELITFNRADLNTIVWEEEGKEFWHNGKMYDIVKSLSSDKTISFYCIRDTKEESLFAFLEELLEKETETEDEENNSCLKKIETQNYLLSSDLYFFETERNCLTSQKQYKLQQGFFSDIPHPPEQA